MGVSFGGILVQETKYVSVKKIVIISSIKSKREFPLLENGKRTNAHKLLPTQWIENIDNLALFAFGKGIKNALHSSKVSSSAIQNI